ncbi:Hypothetical_protein [Hexamita inflata]|uniref:Hypothetical_protein n=1 Tax=Hexamita inflata TaxID=28002 RepID=A0AA86NBC3_9EUKA|nr:Hypothetical protein HINF_LOCUS3940 [Hexamita inflata]
MKTNIKQQLALKIGITKKNDVDLHNITDNQLTNDQNTNVTENIQSNKEPLPHSGKLKDNYYNQLLQTNKSIISDMKNQIQTQNQNDVIINETQPEKQHEYIIINTNKNQPEQNQIKNEYNINTSQLFQELSLLKEQLITTQLQNQQIKEDNKNYQTKLQEQTQITINLQNQQLLQQQKATDSIANQNLQELLDNSIALGRQQEQTIIKLESQLQTYQNEVQVLKQDFSKSQQQIIEYTNKNTVLVQESDNKQIQIHDLTEEISQLRFQLNQSETTLNSIQSELQKSQNHQSHFFSLTQLNQQLNMQIAESEAEVHRLTQELIQKQQIEFAFQNLVEEFEELEQVSTQDSANLKKSEAESQALKTHCKLLNEQIKDLKEKLSAAEEIKVQNLEYSRYIESLKQENMQIKVNVSDQSHALNQTQSSFQSLNVETEQLKVKLSESLQKQVKLESDLTEASIRLEQQNFTLNENELELNHLHQFVDSLQVDITSKQKLLLKQNKSFEEMQNHIKLLQQQLLAEQNAHKSTNQIQIKYDNLDSLNKTLTDQITELQSNCKLLQTKLDYESQLNSKINEMLQEKRSVSQVQCDFYEVSNELKLNKIISEQTKQNLNKLEKEHLKATEENQKLRNELNMVRLQTELINKENKVLNEQNDKYKDENDKIKNVNETNTQISYQTQAVHKALVKENEEITSKYLKLLQNVNLKLKSIQKENEFAEAHIKEMEENTLEIQKEIQMQAELHKKTEKQLQTVIIDGKNLESKLFIEQHKVQNGLEQIESVKRELAQCHQMNQKLINGQ